MKLIQYWDSGDPPEDVRACIESVRELNPGFTHRLYDRARAAWFIGKEVGERERAAFLALAVPAMQADYFRLCAIWAKGGVWLDADCRAMRPLDSLLAEVRSGFLSMREGRLQNHVMVSRTLQSPFVRAAMELATRNIESRVQGQAHMVTGPWVLNLIWAAVDPAGDGEDEHLRRDPGTPRTPEAETAAALCPGAAEAFAAITRRHLVWTDGWVQQAQDAAYKSTARDWRNWDAPIYLD